jgi:hypothetical protein
VISFGIDFMHSFHFPGSFVAENSSNDRPLRFSNRRSRVQNYYRLVNEKDMEVRLCGLLNSEYQYLTARSS